MRYLADIRSACAHKNVIVVTEPLRSTRFFSGIYAQMFSINIEIEIFVTKKIRILAEKKKIIPKTLKKTVIVYKNIQFGIL